MYRKPLFIFIKISMISKMVAVLLILISVFLINPEFAFGTDQVRIKIDSTSYRYSNPSNAFVSGTVLPARGQTVSLYSSSTKDVIGSVRVSGGGGMCSFSFKVPERFLNSNSTSSFLLKSSGTDDVLASRYIPVKMHYEKPASESVGIDSKNSTSMGTTIYATKPDVKTNVKNPVKPTSKETAGSTTSNSGNNTNVKSTKVKQSGVYYIKYDPMGGTGSMILRKAPVGEVIKLNANRFKREGYKFAGWALKSGRPSKNGCTDITKFSNINMKRFQLGKARYKNCEYVKDLASEGNTITIYACWKGKGRKAALDWAKLIANDNEFHYGLKPYSQRGGCYFCKSQYKKSGRIKNRVKTTCCQPFIASAFTHGANFSGTAGKCRRGTVFMPYDYKNSSSFKRVSYSKAKPGDVICFMGNDHVGIYAGKGTLVDAANGDNNVKYSRSWNTSISYGHHKVKWFPGPIKVYRFKY